MIKCHNPAFPHYVELHEDQIHTLTGTIAISELSFRNGLKEMVICLGLIKNEAKYNLSSIYTIITFLEKKIGAN